MAPEATMSVVPNAGSGKMTVPDLLQRKSSGADPRFNSQPQKITCLTAYDYPTARLLDEAGVDVLLVGDSLGMVVLGYDSTLPVSVEEMLHHTRAVRRGRGGRWWWRICRMAATTATSRSRCGMR